MGPWLRLLLFWLESILFNPNSIHPAKKMLFCAVIFTPHLIIIYARHLHPYSWLFDFIFSWGNNTLARKIYLQVANAGYSFILMFHLNFHLWGKNFILTWCNDSSFSLYFIVRWNTSLRSPFHIQSLASSSVGLLN